VPGKPFCVLLQVVNLPHGLRPVESTLDALILIIRENRHNRNKKLGTMKSFFSVAGERASGLG
jgi:hypothetical protein